MELPRGFDLDPARLGLDPARLGKMAAEVHSAVADGYLTLAAIGRESN
jgi:hypothetical protein